MNVGEIAAPTVCYARVSSHDQKEDLQRQQPIARQKIGEPK
jgi:putative resolvase